MMEKITNADKNHLRRLFNLNTPPDLVRILRIDNLDSHHPVVEMVSYTCMNYQFSLTERESTKLRDIPPSVKRLHGK